MIRGFLLCIVALGAAAAGAADREAEFRAAYSAYIEAVDRGDYEGAADAGRQALSLSEGLIAADSESMATLTSNVGYALMKSGAAEEARTLLTESLQIHETLYGKKSVKLIPVYMDLAEVSAEYHAPRTQRFYLDKALKIAAQEYGDEGLEYARLSLRGGTDILNLSRSPDARPYLETAHAIFTRHPDTDPQELAMTQMMLGKLEISTAHYEKAAVYLREAIDGFDALSADETIALTARTFLINAYEEQGLSDLATEQCLIIGRTKPHLSTHDYQPLYKKIHEYPAEANRRQLSGEVLVEFTVDENGFVREPRVVNSSMTVFEQSALDAARGFRYAPRFENGEPVAVENVQTRFVYRYR